MIKDEKFSINKNDIKVVASLLVIFVTTCAALLYLANRADITAGDDGTAAAENTAGRRGSAAEGSMAGRNGSAADDSMTDRDGDGKQRHYYAAQQPSVKLSHFDPNTADSTQLLALGLQPWQVKNIYRYRAAGGVYRRPQDFARLYGLSAHKYKQLLPYIRIAPEYSMTAAEYVSRNSPARQTISDAWQQEKAIASSSSKTTSAATDKIYGTAPSSVSPRNRKLSPGEHVSLNGADTTALMRVPGIGRWYARSIVRYGERLGGYVSVDQLMEIEDFPADALPYIKLGKATPRKLNVNSASLAELRKHPYINYYQAKAITDYRRLYGKITDINVLATCSDFTERDLKRIAPYIEY